jgi:hypothetical protein
MHCHYLCVEKVCHTFSDSALPRLEPPIEVPFFLLTRDPLRPTMPRVHTYCPRLQYVTEPILTAPNCRFRH